MTSRVTNKKYLLEIAYGRISFVFVKKMDLNSTTTPKPMGHKRATRRAQERGREGGRERGERGGGRERGLRGGRAHRQR